MSKLDEINPAELTTQMRVFQKYDDRKARDRGDETRAEEQLLITLWSSAAIFAMLINFTVVVVFLQTLDTPQTLVLSAAKIMNVLLFGGDIRDMRNEIILMCILLTLHLKH